MPRHQLRSFYPDRPTVIPVGWTPPAGPQPYSEKVQQRRLEAELTDILRSERDAQRYDVVFVDGQLVVRVREQVAA